MKSKILSIYLPQFHAIPENDEWWGTGFTEWVNVKRGRKFYPGHYQPREPLHDDYYDLSDIKVLEKHTKLAKKAGISGFCFYQYYFCGKKLLEKPIETYRDYSKADFPDCLIWANESWMRTWYRAPANNTLLMRQVYGDENEWKEHFYYLLMFFKDKRYIKIDNKPVYIIYIPQNIRYRKEMFTLWRKLAKEEGFDGLFLIAMNTSHGKADRSDVYDAYLNFEPMVSLFGDDISWRKHILNWKGRHINLIRKNRVSWINRVLAKNDYSYSYLCKFIEKKAKRSDKKTYSGIFSGWDNTSRKDEAGIIIRGSSPKKFGKHILKMLRISERSDKEYIFLNAWNEWSEGAYVEPDKKYGYRYLRALRHAVFKYNNESVTKGKEY